MVKIEKADRFSIAGQSNSQMRPLRIFSDEERVALLRLARTENVGPISFFHLLERFKSPEEALDRLPSLAQRRAVKIPSLDEVRCELDLHEQKGYSLLSYYDADYPACLRSLKDAPPFLTLWGNKALLQQSMLAIVGARNASHAGERMASEIAHTLSHHFVIVSGMARGVDACIHRASLDQCGTVAVLAGGIHHIYPPEHKGLYGEIAEKGLLISEDALRQSPSASLFIKRNRIISGLSWGVLVVEASLKSGSLSTAKYAADQGRSVLAVPGHPLDFRARGTNKLIKQGAVLVESAEDVLTEYAGLHRYAGNDASVWGKDQLSYPSVFCAQETSLGYTPTSAWETFGLHPSAIDSNSWDKDLGFDINLDKNGDVPIKKSMPSLLNSDGSLLENLPNFNKSEHFLGENLWPLYILDAAQRIKEKLSFAPISVDTICEKLGLDAALVRTALIELELNGEICRQPGDCVMLYD